MAVDILELAQTAPLEIRQKFQQREYSEGDCIISPAAMPTCCLKVAAVNEIEAVCLAVVLVGVFRDESRKRVLAVA